MRQWRQIQIRQWLFEMYGDKHLAKLLELSAYVNKKDGKAVEGVKTYEELREDMERDYFMSAEQAVAYGLADQVVANRASIT